MWKIGSSTRAGSEECLMQYDDPILRKWLADPKKARKFHRFVTSALIAAMLSMTVGGIMFVLALAGFF